MSETRVPVAELLAKAQAEEWPTSSLDSRVHALVDPPTQPLAIPLVRPYVPIPTTEDHVDH